jgi:exodeoxyribonuclease-3
MRIATWNVNGWRARADYIRLWLEDRQPDVVGIQELKTADDVFPHADIEALGYRALVHGQKAWNGVAILVRDGFEAEVTQVGLPGQEDFGSRLITATVGDLSFTTVYCPNGKTVEHDDFPRKLAWFDALASHLDAHHRANDPFVLCGDFNICPAAIDSWDEESLAGHIFHTDAERERMQALAEWGLADLFRHLHPDEQQFSWWDYRGAAFRFGRGLRIDLLLGTPAIVGRLESVTIDRDFRKKKEGLTASDHCPVLAELR